MKRLLALLLAACLAFAAIPALAQEESYDDDPFLPGIDYTKKYTDYGAKPSMLNFGSVKRSDIETRSIFENSVKKTTIKTTSAKKIEDSLFEGDLLYYIYAKWQTARSVPTHTIDAMLVMTDPYGKHYTTYQEVYVEGISSNYRYSGLPRYFDVTPLIARCYLENGSLPTGKYTFTMYFNDQFFRQNDDVYFK